MSLPHGAIYLPKKRCADNGLPRRGSQSFYLASSKESFPTNTVDTRAAYVAIRRARSGASIYTDSRARLLDVLGLRDGVQVGAIDEAMGRDTSFALGG